MAQTKADGGSGKVVLPPEEQRSFQAGDFVLSPSAEELKTLICSKPGLIWCVVEDEKRFRDNIYAIAKILGRRPIFWSCYTGMVEWLAKDDLNIRPDGEPIMAPMQAIELAFNFDHKVAVVTYQGGTEALETIYPNAEEIRGSIFVLHDMHRFIEDPMVLRALKDLGELAFWNNEDRNLRKAVIITSPHAEVPMELRDITTVVDFALPTPSEIEGLLKCVTKDNVVKKLSASTQAEIVKSSQGMSLTRILHSVRQCAVANNYKLTPEMIGHEKRQIIRQSGILEIIPADITVEDIGGMDNIKKHFGLMKHALHNVVDATKRNIKTTSDILLVGIPGCGKSYSSRAAANELGVDAVRLDMGSIYNSFVGASEANMRKALHTVEAVRPVVLLVDEIEKGMAGSQSSGQTDGGTSARVFGHFLTWMQEKPDGISLIATANDISQLPPEFLRKGRFDEVYYVGLPTVEERADIFRIHLAKTVLCKPEDFDLEELAKMTEFFTGAEIEALLQRANLISFSKKEQLKTEHVLALIPSWKILYDTEKKKVAQLEERAADTWAWSSSLQERDYDINKGKRAMPAADHPVSSRRPSSSASGRAPTKFG